jgi:hypothetical protein
MPKTHRFSATTLSQSPFYKLRTRKRLAQVLLTQPAALERLRRKDALYVRLYKHKTLESKWLREYPPPDEAHLYRAIDIPHHDLKVLQYRIADLLGRVTPPDYLFSPVKGRSYVDNASRHKGARAFHLLDIADYFPSCSANNVARLFSHQLCCTPDVTAILVRVTTHEGGLPQGSPCSPVLAFYSNYEMWEEIATLVESNGCTLSVYADDVTISGETVPGALIWDIKRCIHGHGLRVKREKEVSLKDAPADVTGVIIRGDRTLLPNRQLEQLALLRAERNAARNPKTRKQLDSKIAGRIAQRRQVEGGS